ncbi:MAG: glycosyltransferase, partial [Chloroflexota bacterium]
MTPSQRTDPSSRARRPVCMIVHAYYEEDARVRRQAEMLVANGRPVDVFALRRPGAGAEDVVEGVRLRRLPVRRHQGAGIATYLAEYLAFFTRALFAATAAHRRRRYALVQVHTLPDFLVFAGLPMRLVGIPLVLDLHEAMPEFFRSRFPSAAGPIPHAFLRAQEALATTAADAVITVNDALGDRLLDLGLPPDKLTVVLNTPALTLFDPDRTPRRPFRADGRLRLVYAGAVTPMYELDVVLDAVARLAGTRPDLDVALDVYGRGDAADGLVARATSLGVNDRVVFHGRIPLEDVPGAIAAADVGLAPTRRDRFTDFSLSTKLFEYAAMGKPVVASRLPTVERYFPEGTVATYAAGDAPDLARVLERVADDPLERAGRIARTAARVAELGWDREGERY